MKTIVFILKNVIVYILLALISFLMLQGIIMYLPLKDDIGFLQFKKEYLNIIPWKIAFYIHVFSIFFALISGFTQFSTYVLKYYKKAHRLIGKLYVYTIFLNFPVAFIMGVYANGLWPTKLAFILLDCLWFWFTLKAIIILKRVI